MFLIRLIAILTERRIYLIHVLLESRTMICRSLPRMIGEQSIPIHFLKKGFLNALDVKIEAVRSILIEIWLRRHGSTSGRSPRDNLGSSNRIVINGQPEKPRVSIE
jgi:hypothetical protein